MGTSSGFDQYGTDQAATAQAHQLYLKILGDFPALIWRAGLDTKCDWFNSTWLEFTGRSMDQETGNGWAEGVHPEDLQRCVDFYLDNFKRREPFRMEYRLRHHSGEYRWILDIGRPFFDLDNQFLGYIGSCYDVTEEHRMVKQLTDLGIFRDRLFSIIGHDLKNQLGTISALADVMGTMLPANVPQEFQEFTADIQTVSHKTIDLLRDLMDWASARLGLVQAKRTAFDLAAQVSDLVELFAVPAEKKAIRVINGLQGPIAMSSDPDMLRTIIRNLVGNAIKFTPAGGTVSLTSFAAGGNRHINVTDTGRGIEDATLELLRSSTGPVGSRPGTANESGTGLGLMLVRELLALLGGRLEISSRFDQGSRFSIVLPESPAGEGP